MSIGGGNAETQHDRHFASPLLHGLCRSVYGDAGIEGVEYGLDEDGVDTSLKQGFHLLYVGIV